MASVVDYDEAMETIPAGGGTGNDLKNLPDGKYEFGCVKAAFKTVEKTGSQCVDLSIEVLSTGPSEGKKFQHTYWLTNKDDGSVNEVSVGILKKDLETLGFDVPLWKKANGRPFSQELKKALKIMESGIQFHAKKASNAKGYAQLYIEIRSITDGKPAAFGPAEMDAAVKVPFNADVDY